MHTPIILLVSERSGSNLLRTLLGNHQKIVAPVAPHFFHAFYKYSRHYYLNGSIDCRSLCSDFTELANHPYHDWKLRASSEEIIETHKPKNFAEVFSAIYSQKALESNKVHFCSKGIDNLFYAGYIKAMLPNAKFIYLSRDPRDHAASWLRTPLYLHTTYQIISKWNEEQKICINVLCNLPDVYHIRYEDLIDNPAAEMTRIQEFLGLEIDPNCFSTDPGNTEAKRNEFWKNLNKPIDPLNKKKYLKSLSEQQLNLIETESEENMRFLGYTDYETSRNWEMGNKYWFHAQEAYRTKMSKSRNGDLFNKKMSELQDKISFEKDLIKNRIK